jgi:hypothetical protein
MIIEKKEPEESKKEFEQKDENEDNPSGKKEEESKEKKEEEVDLEKFNEALITSKEKEIALAEANKKIAELQKALEGKEKSPEKKEDEEEEADESQGEEDKKEEEKQDISKIVEQAVSEKVKPFEEAEAKRQAEVKEKSRKAFWTKHPEYLRSGEKWNELMEEMEKSISPNSPDPYFTQLEKAHRILNPSDSILDKIEEKQALSSIKDSNSSGEVSTPPESRGGEGKLSSTEKKEARDIGITEEQALALKEKQSKGKMTLFYPIS